MSAQFPKTSKSLMQIFAIPLAIFGLGLAGLIFALLKNGLGDMVANSMVAIGPLVALWIVFLRRRAR